MCPKSDGLVCFFLSWFKQFQRSQTENIYLPTTLLSTYCYFCVGPFALRMAFLGGIDSTRCWKHTSDFLPEHSQYKLQVSKDNL